MTPSKSGPTLPKRKPLPRDITIAEVFVVVLGFALVPFTMFLLSRSPGLSVPVFGGGAPASKYRVWRWVVPAVVGVLSVRFLNQAGGGVNPARRGGPHGDYPGRGWERIEATNIRATLAIFGCAIAACYVTVLMELFAEVRPVGRIWLFVLVGIALFVGLAAEAWTLVIRSNPRREDRLPGATGRATFAGAPAVERRADGGRRSHAAPLAEQIDAIIAEIDADLLGSSDDEERWLLLAIKPLFLRVAGNLDRPEIYSELLDEAARAVVDGWPRDSALGGRILDLTRGAREARKRQRR